MARKRISEFRAKTLLHRYLGTQYDGISIDAETDWHKAIIKLPTRARWVVKVDQGIKGRFKKELVLLDRTANQVRTDAESLIAKGYQHLLLEPYQAHKQEQERYLAIERTRAGDQVSYSTAGGVDIEAHESKIQKIVLCGAPEREQVAKALELDLDAFNKLLTCFGENYFSFMEINPLIVDNGMAEPLDAAIEVDSAGAFFVGGRWDAQDYRSAANRKKTPAELTIERLADQSQASFSLELLNPEGRIFVLLSGGGASVVVADEVHNLGAGRELGNYGEYSGNPNTDETYEYTSQVISLLLKSSARNKVLIIGGGVANFTDIRATFKGVIRALQQAADGLRRQHIKIFVRRGGPHEMEGLQLMRDFLLREDLLGMVSGPEEPLSAVVAIALGRKPEEASSRA